MAKSAPVSPLTKLDVIAEALCPSTRRECFGERINGRKSSCSIERPAAVDKETEIQQTSRDSEIQKIIFISCEPSCQVKAIDKSNAVNIWISFEVSLAALLSAAPPAVHAYQNRPLFFVCRGMKLLSMPITTDLCFGVPLHECERKNVPIISLPASKPPFLNRIIKAPVTPLASNLRSRLQAPAMAMATTAKTHFLLLLLVLLPLLVPNDAASARGPIKTVVVLVMENRSFDHMLGWMKRLNPSIDGVTGAESNRLSTTDPNSPRFYFKDQAQYVDPDPGHSFQAIREQIFGSNDTSASPPPMNGFAQQAYSMTGSTNMSENVMNGFPADMVAVYKALVEEFAVVDRWFASVPSSTQPNRLYVHSGTSNGATSNIPSVQMMALDSGRWTNPSSGAWLDVLKSSKKYWGVHMHGGGCIDKKISHPTKSLLALGYPQRTIFENLDAEGLSFGIYYQNIPATLFYRNLRKLKYLPKFHSYDLAFKNHAQHGKLPNYVVVEQRYMDSKLTPANDDHPSHDVYQGRLYETLRASPQWNQTLLVITYDEHGGFYDHVPTPSRNVPSPDDIVGPEPFLFKFDRLGVRVPTILVSPWIEKGTVVHGPNGSPSPSSEYEHSSIPATVKKLFNLSSPFLTKRDAWAGTFEGVLTRTEPRTDCPEKLPTPTKIREGEANEGAQLSEFQRELIQLAAVLKGDHILTSFPEQIGKQLSVREGQQYMEDALKRFFEAGLLAKRMGVDEEKIVEMRPSLTTRSSPSTTHP
ncbi:Phosphatidylglycerol/phosphatidylinositol transfer protein [Asimina triloba]